MQSVHLKCIKFHVFNLLSLDRSKNAAERFMAEWKVFTVYRRKIFKTAHLIFQVAFFYLDTQHKSHKNEMDYEYEPTIRVLFCFFFFVLSIHSSIVRKYANAGFECRDIMQRLFNFEASILGRLKSNISIIISIHEVHAEGDGIMWLYAFYEHIYEWPFVSVKPNVTTCRMAASIFYRHSLSTWKYG